MGKTDNESEGDARLLDDLLTAAQVIPPADPFNGDHSLTDALVDLLKLGSVRGTVFRLRDRFLPTEDERRQVAEAADPLVRWCWSDQMSWGYVWWGALGQTREDYLLKRQRIVALLRALRAKLPTAELGRNIASPAPDAGEWLPVSEAAQRADLTLETVRGWVNRTGNPLPRKTIGGIAHVCLADVIAERDAKRLANPKRRTPQRLPTSAPKFEKLDAPRSRKP